MENFVIEELDIIGSDFSKVIYGAHSSLQEEKEQFESFIKETYNNQFDERVKRSVPKQRNYSSKSANYQKLMNEAFQDPNQPQMYAASIGGSGKVESKGFSLFNPFKEFIEDIIEKNENKLIDCIRGSKVQYTLQGLDNSEINFDKLKIVNDKLVYDSVHNNLEVITFLISGYTTQEDEAKSNFKSIASEPSKTNSPNNLFVNFRWSSSSPTHIVRSFLADLTQKYIFGKSDDDELIINFCENYLKSIMDNSSLNPIFKHVVYFIIRSLLLFMKTRVLKGFAKLVLGLIVDLLDSVIKDFQLTYDMSKKSGALLTTVIQDLRQAYNPNVLNIDLMGHSLGTVVIQSSLSNLSAKKLTRYLILMGGVTTIQEMLTCNPTFEKCFNYYSTGDEVLQKLLVDGKILGPGLIFAGLNPFDESSGVYFNSKLSIGHTDYSSQYSRLYDQAFETFEKDEEEEEEIKRSIYSNINETPTDQDVSTTGLYFALSIPVITLGIYYAYKYFSK